MELPKRIKPLDPQLVNRIAAGEIIQRPFNALKELIENCLDAGSTSINIQLKDGGLKSIQIQDNGCGIDKDDLKIVCERFTTSKLKEFEDLKSINTFGFRGEALASISHISRLTITSRTANSQCAFRATYSEGKLVDSIKPCASASKGTVILVEDLFYNSSIRRNALRNGSEEFSKIFDVVSRYAIHNYHVSFFLKRIGESSMDLKTNGCQAAANKERCEENETVLLENIGIVYGNELKKELERIVIEYDELLKFEMSPCYFSNSKYTQLKQTIFILFINERLVDCQPIKKMLQSVFSLYMPKNTNFFIYMNLKLDPKNLDVNIHPTKHEVRFLYQDEIINKIQSCFELKLVNSNVSRTYYVKNLTLDTFVDSTNKKSASQTDSETGDEADASKKNSQVIYPYQLTRVDSKERKLDSFLHQTSLNESIRSFKENSSIIREESKKKKGTDEEEKEDVLKSPLRYQKLERILNFKSISELRDKVERCASKNVKKVLDDMNFVGCLDRELALIQHQTGLYIANTRILSQELFYQICLFNFGNFGYFRLEEPIEIYDLAFMALNDPDTEWEPEDGPKDKLAKRCAKFLYGKAAMLDDYFSIKIKKLKNEETSEEKIVLEALPMLMEDYEPDLVELPLFIIRLATEVDYEDEKKCFDSISKEMSYFYSIKNCKYAKQEEQPSTQADKPKENWMIEHFIYTAIKNMLLASTKKEEQIFFKLVDLSKLYKVFERC